MTQDKSQMDSAGHALGKWIGDLRKELEDVRAKASAMDGLEPLKFRLGAIEVEAKLLETFVSLLSKNIEVVGKLLTS